MVLLLPLSAFFSAISLAVGAYARSSKEGQYYLMPLFLVTMPLMFLTLAPGVELNPFYSLVPVTGAALLMQKLMTATSLAQVPWLYFIPVLAPIVLYSYLALRWAIAQFHREEVLFREAERLDVKLWLRRLFREKEETPTTGQAFFIFALVLVLHWLSLSVGGQLPMVTHTAIRLLAFVATPPLLLTMLLNTKPLLGLRLKWPKLREIGLAALLAVLLLAPVACISVEVLTNYPHVARLLQQRQPSSGRTAQRDRRPAAERCDPVSAGLGSAAGVERRALFSRLFAVGHAQEFSAAYGSAAGQLHVRPLPHERLSVSAGVFRGRRARPVDPAQPQPGAGLRFPFSVQDAADCRRSHLWHGKGRHSSGG